MTDQPDPRASLKGLMALVLDMVRADPDRRPSQEMLRWHQELAETVGIQPAPVRTNRELLDGALRIDRVLRDANAESGQQATRVTQGSQTS